MREDLRITVGAAVLIQCDGVRTPRPVLPGIRNVAEREKKSKMQFAAVI